MKTALTIAGSDPTGAAGLEADLRVFQSLGLHGTAVATALTVQDTSRVHEVVPVAAGLFRRRLEVLLADIRPAVVKIGMLATGEIAAITAELLERLAPDVPLVIDPVLVSSSGAPLLDEEGLVVLRERLLPRARAITPNRSEAAAILRREGPPEELATALAAMGPEIVVVTGGDADEPEVRNAVWMDGRCTVSVGERVAGPSPHGTGCTFAAALARYLVSAFRPAEALAMAALYASRAVRDAEPADGSSGRPLPRLWGNSNDE